MMMMMTSSMRTKRGKQLMVCYSLTSFVWNGRLWSRIKLLKIFISWSIQCVSIFDSIVWYTSNFLSFMWLPLCVRPYTQSVCGDDESIGRYVDAHVHIDFRQTFHRSTHRNKLQILVCVVYAHVKSHRRWHQENPTWMEKWANEWAMEKRIKLMIENELCRPRHRWHKYICTH